MKIMVLNDGETYTSLAGCFVAEVPDDSWDDLDELLSRFKDDRHEWMPDVHLNVELMEDEPIHAYRLRFPVEEVRPTAEKPAAQ